MFILLVLGLVATQTAALYGPGTNVVELTEANFDRLVVNSDEVWVVEFFAPWCGHCQQLVPEYKKLATALKGVVKVGSVNADDHKTLGGTYGVRGFPTIKIFGGNKRKPDDFNGERTAQGMASAALAAAKKKVSDQLGGKSGGSSDNSGGSSGGDDVIELTDANFKKLVLDSDEMWLVEFFAPWCGHCKNLEPQWAKAASSLRGKFKLGALDATVHKTIAARYEIQGYPTIKYFPADRKNDPVDYDGGRTSGDIVNWATDKLAENIPVPEVVQITGADIFAAECDKKPLCVVSVLPHILDCQAECRNQYLDLLKAMGEKYKQKMWGWLWSEGGSQMELESSLDIGGFGYPAMAVVNVKKMKYSLFRGSFSKDGIIEFLRDLSFGRGNTAPIKGAQLPTVIKSEKWDGNDGELPQEEEIDLTDVDLDKDEL